MSQDCQSRCWGTCFFSFFLNHPVFTFLCVQNYLFCVCVCVFVCTYIPTYLHICALLSFVHSISACACWHHSLMSVVKCGTALWYLARWCFWVIHSLVLLIETIWQWRGSGGSRNANDVIVQWWSNSSVNMLLLIMTWKQLHLCDSTFIFQALCMSVILVVWISEEDSDVLYADFLSVFPYRASMCLQCTSSCTTSCAGQLKPVILWKWVAMMVPNLLTREGDPQPQEATSANQLRISSAPWKRYICTHRVRTWWNIRCIFEKSLISIYIFVERNILPVHKLSLVFDTAIQFCFYFLGQFSLLISFSHALIPRALFVPFVLVHRSFLTSIDRNSTQNVHTCSEAKFNSHHHSFGNTGCANLCVYIFVSVFVTPTNISCSCDPCATSHASEHWKHPVRNTRTTLL